MTRRRNRTRMFSNWYGLAMLGLETQHVMALRMLKLSRGGLEASAEAELMVLEKFTAGAQACGRLLMGDSSSQVVAGYRRKVRANARRLSAK